MGNSDGEAKLILEQIHRLFHGATLIEKHRPFLDKKINTQIIQEPTTLTD